MIRFKRNWYNALVNYLASPHRPSYTFILFTIQVEMLEVEMMKSASYILRWQSSTKSLLLMRVKKGKMEKSYGIQTLHSSRYMPLF